MLLLPMMKFLSLVSEMMQKQKKLKQKVVNGFKHLIKQMFTKNGSINPKFLIKNYRIVVEINLKIMYKMMKSPVQKSKPKQFQQRVKQLMDRQKSQLKSKGQRMPSHF